jgi:hypothetical protein
MLALAITRFEADPAEVSQILDLEPTSIWRKGEIGENGQPRRVNAWWLDAYPVQLEQGIDHEQALSAIIDRIRGRESHFARLRDEVAPEILTISGEMHSPKGEWGVWLSPDQMSVLANCGVSWGLDLFRAD